MTFRERYHVLIPIGVIYPMIIYYSAMKRVLVILSSPTRLWMNQSSSRNRIKQTPPSSHCPETTDVSIFNENVNTVSQSILQISFQTHRRKRNVLASHCLLITHSRKPLTGHEVTEMNR